VWSVDGLLQDCREMSKAPARTALALAALALALPLSAQAQTALPAAGGCWLRDYDAAHLARHPQQHVAGLRIWFYDAVRGDPESRTAAVEARLAGGRVLTSHHACRGQPGATGIQCHTDCDGGWFTPQPRADGRLDIITDRVWIGDPEDGCGGAIDLAEVGRRTVYRLSAAPDTACAALNTVHPIPDPGCYGADGAGAGPLTGLRLVLAGDPGQDELTFPAIGATIEFALADEPALGGLSGARPRVWFGCSATEAACRLVHDARGDLVLSQAGRDLDLRTSGLILTDPGGGSELDLTAALRAFPRLVRLPDTACEGVRE